MYKILLMVHNLVAWAVLGTGLLVLVKSLTAQARWSDGDTAWVRRLTLFVHLQLLAGIGLWFTSPAIAEARTNMGGAMKDATLRRLLVEHPSLMLLAAVVATISSVRVRKAVGSAAKAKTALVGTAITLVLIAAVIPWARLVTVWTTGS